VCKWLEVKLGPGYGQLQYFHASKSQDDKKSKHAVEKTQSSMVLLGMCGAEHCLVTVMVVEKNSINQDDSYMTD
ncbi:hypothetical protein Ancab_021962, partial [Ancistrocladus abbreviatus]